MTLPLLALEGSWEKANNWNPVEVYSFLGLTLVKEFPCKEEMTLILCFIRFCCIKKQGRWECWTLRCCQGTNRWWCGSLARQTNGWHHLVLLCASCSPPVRNSCHFLALLLLNSQPLNYRLHLSVSNPKMLQHHSWLQRGMACNYCKTEQKACVLEKTCVMGGLLQEAKTLLVCLSSNGN